MKNTPITEESLSDVIEDFQALSAVLIAFRNGKLTEEQAGEKLGLTHEEFHQALESRFVNLVTRRKKLKPSDILDAMLTLMPGEDRLLCAILGIRDEKFLSEYPLEDFYQILQDHLSEREYEFLCYRFAFFDDVAVHTVKDTAVYFKTTQERIRFRERAILKKLRRHLPSFAALIDPDGKWTRKELTFVLPVPAEEPETQSKDVPEVVYPDLDTILKARIINALKRNGVFSLKDLQNYTYIQVSGFDGLGTKALEEVVQVMRTYKVKFKTQ